LSLTTKKTDSVIAGKRNSNVNFRLLENSQKIFLGKNVGLFVAKKAIWDILRSKIKILSIRYFFL